MTLCIQIMIPIAGWVAPFGYPRIKACSRLPMAFRSVPRPSSPPGAKASTECPYRAQQSGSFLSVRTFVHHAQEPATHLLRCAVIVRADKQRGQPGPIELVRWEPSHTLLAPLNVIRCSSGQIGRTATRSDAPEPIHLPKNNTRRPRSSRFKGADTFPPATTFRSVACPLTHSPVRLSPDENGGDDRDRTDDPLLAKQVLSQLSYAPIGPSSRTGTRIDGGPGRT